MNSTTTARRINPHALRTEAAILTTDQTPPKPAMSPAQPASTRRLPIAAIRLDGGTQPRAALNEEYIAELAAELAAGAVLPPVDVMYDGETYWLFDGYHRVHATRRTRGDDAAIDVRVHQGGQADAQWASYAQNKAHGLRRTNEDKQRAIVAALKHSNGASRTNREIARHLGVDHVTVGNWRARLELSGEIHQIEDRTVTRGDQTYTQSTASIGSTPARSTVVASDATHTRQQGAPLGKCSVCNRPLTDPVQAAQGIGACCAAKQAAGVNLSVDGDRPLPDWVTAESTGGKTMPASVNIPLATVGVTPPAGYRVARLNYWRERFQELRHDVDDWCKLTGQHLTILPLCRELDKLTAITERELAALTTPVQMDEEEI